MHKLRRAEKPMWQHYNVPYRVPYLQIIRELRLISFADCHFHFKDNQLLLKTFIAVHCNKILPKLPYFKNLKIDLKHPITQKPYKMISKDWHPFLFEKCKRIKYGNFYLSHWNKNVIKFVKISIPITRFLTWEY